MAEESTGFGSFVPTTNVFAIENLDQIELNSPEFRGFLVDIRKTLNRIALVLNTKDSGIYYPEEFVTGSILFPNPALDATTAQQPNQRQVHRKVINFGTLPNAGTTNVAHGITFPTPNTYSFVNIYGAATDQTGGSYLPLPYSSTTLVNNIEVSVDNTNVSITTGINRTAYTITYIILEYIKE
jgi:hypothetical protein